MANTLPFYTLPANINTNSLIKYFIDPVDDANSGFYLYLWDVEAGVFTRSEQYSDDTRIYAGDDQLMATLLNFTGTLEGSDFLGDINVEYINVPM